MTADGGGCVLDRVEEFLSRFVSFPSPEHLVAVVLWAAHTHLLASFESTPRLALLSPEPGSGKTRVLEVLETLVPNPLFSINVTSAALFRKVADVDARPTVLFDEIDTIFGPRAKEHEDVRGLLNAGHRRSGTAIRCVVRGRNIEVEELPAYAAVAMAGLGDLPDTLMSRAVVVRMRRRAPHEQVEPFRRRVHGPEGNELRDQLEVWARVHGLAMLDVWPTMPAGIEDRPADVWEPLLAVADAAGGDWPKAARAAAVTIVATSKGEPASLGVRLLDDLRTVFATEDAVSTDELLARLHDLDEAPWSDLRGKPLDARGLAHRLKQYGVGPKVIRVGDRTARGYARDDLHDPWSRYLAATDVTHVTDPWGGQETAAELPLPPPCLSTEGHVTDVTNVAACRHCHTPLDPALTHAGYTTHPACDGDQP